MSRRTLATTLAAAVVGLAVSLFYHVAPGEAHAASPRAAVALGMPASTIVARHGSPIRISYADFTQVWFYKNESGSVMPRFEVNQGLVVKIRW